MRSSFLRIMYLGWFLGLSGLGFSQEDIQRLQVEMASGFRLLRNAQTEDERIKTGRGMDSVFRRILQLPDSFHHPLDSLTNVGKIYSPDTLVRIYTWNIPRMDGTHRYFGYIQQWKDGHTEWIRLEHSPAEQPEPLSVFSEKNWYGALYYQVFQEVCNGKTYYFLLAMDLHNPITTRKIIDVIVFEKGKITLGAPLFRTGKSFRNRVVFEYSSQVSMMLRYVPEARMIVFDHLSPPEPRLQGQYQFYGPDFSYDGFRFQPCEWVLQEDLDLTNLLHH